MASQPAVESDEKREFVAGSVEEMVAHLEKIPITECSFATWDEHIAPLLEICDQPELVALMPDFATAVSNRVQIEEFTTARGINDHQDVVLRRFALLPLRSLSLLPKFIYRLETPGQVLNMVQAGIDLEWITLPVYLSGLYSILDDGSDWSAEASTFIRTIMHEEMVHFGYACNLFNAIADNVSPAPAGPAIKANTPAFPVANLPGGVLPTVKNIDVGPATRDRIFQYMAIEQPEWGNAKLLPLEASDITPLTDMHDGTYTFEVTLRKTSGPSMYPTIGQFYLSILHALQDPAGNIQIQDNRQLAFSISGVTVTKITNLKQAADAINLITNQGEGSSSDSPFVDPNATPKELSHYHKFLSLYVGSEITGILDRTETTDTVVYKYSSAKNFGETAHVHDALMPVADTTFSQSYGSMISDLDNGFQQADPNSDVTSAWANAMMPMSSAYKAAVGNGQAPNWTPTFA